MTIILTFALAGLITYGLRSAMVIAGDRPQITAFVESRAGLILPAVLAAIMAGAMFTSGGSVRTPNPVELAAVAAGALAVRRFGNAGAALAVGLPVYWLGSAVGLT